MSYYTTLPDTLLFNGTDIQGISGIVVNDLSGIFAPGARRGNHDTIPGRRGVLGAELPYDAFSFAVPITVLGTTHYQMLSILAAAGTALAGTSGLGTLERRLDNGSGGYVTQRARGQFASFNSTSLLNFETGSTELTFVNLSGGWTADALPTDPAGDDSLTWVVP